MTAPLSTLSAMQASAITENLRQQLALYHQVRDVLLQKKVSILQQALESLKEQDAELRTLRKEANQLEKQRSAMLREFWPQALAPVQASMMRLAMPEAQRPDFEQVRLALKQTLELVHSLQQNIEELLNDSLGWVQQSMNLLTQHLESEKSTTYTAAGKAQRQGQLSIMQTNI